MEDIKSPKEFYNSKLAARKSFEDRAEKFAELTMPALFRDTGSSGADELPKKHVQSLGAKIVKSLQSKIGLTMFPPASTGFKLAPNAEAMEEFTQGDQDLRDEVLKSVSSATDSINKEIEIQNIRRDVFSLIEQQLVVGACVMEKIPKNGIKIHNLRNIVATLDDSGDAFELCVKETAKKLPEGLDSEQYSTNADDEYEIYTMAYEDEESGNWIVKQEIGDTVIDEEGKEYSPKEVPFQYVGMVWNIGEEYHRPFVEDYYGDLNAYDKLSRVLTEGSIIASKSLTFVDQRGGRTRKEDVAESENGAVVDGSADDVTSFQHGKNYDFQVAMQTRAEIRAMLEEAFLTKNAITRNAERVTAEEIRTMTQELETSLAGVYAVVTNKIVQRVVDWIMGELKIKFDTIEVEIVTGLNAMGKSNEVVKLDGLVRRLAELDMLDMVRQSELATRYAEGYGVNTRNLYKSQAELAQEREAARQQMAQQQLIESGAESMGKEGGRQLAQGGGQNEQ